MDTMRFEQPPTSDENMSQSSQRSQLVRATAHSRHNTQLDEFAVKIQHITTEAEYQCHLNDVQRATNNHFNEELVRNSTQSNALYSAVHYIM